MAGTSEVGHCPHPGCGARWVRVVERETRQNWNDGRQQKHDGTYYRLNPGGGVGNDRREAIDRGFEPTCDHGLEPVPDVVLDPFLGSGTVARVAQDFGRDWIGVDLNSDYEPMQKHRTAQMALVLGPSTAQIAT